MEVYSNMAGVLIEYLVNIGEIVDEGQDIVSLESMKMEIPVQSTASGVVTEVKLNPGDFVNEGDLLLVLE